MKNLRLRKVSNIAVVFQFSTTEFDVIFVAFIFSGGGGITALSGRKIQQVILHIAKND